MAHASLGRFDLVRRIPHAFRLCAGEKGVRANVVLPRVCGGIGRLLPSYNGMEKRNGGGCVRRHGGLKRAAALCVSAAFIWMGALAHGGIRRGKALTIEVVFPQEDVQAAALQAQDQPTVLIYHTHTWEAYRITEDAAYTPTQTWRTMDNTHNMVRIGEELAKELTALGFAVTHDTTAFEPPDLSTSYERSLDMLERRLDAGETYDYYLDVHRDAFSGLRNGANSAASPDGQVAYVMMLVGKGTGQTGSGFDERPDWPKNLELAQRITDEMNALLPGVARDVKIKTGRFNQHVSAGALLIEVGNNRNTLDEALAACSVIAQAIAGAHAAQEESGAGAVR